MTIEHGAEIVPPTESVSEVALVPRAVGASMLERWVEENPEKAIEKLETMVRVLDRLRRASIAATYPSDWLIHSSKDAEGNIIRQVGYLQDCGAERAGKLWGISISSPTIEREDFPSDSTFSYHMMAEARSNVTGEVLDAVEGSRWSGQGFFQRKSSDGPNEKVNPTDVRKAAYANCHGRAVRALAGLNAVPLDMLTQAGIDVSKVVMIGYSKGAKGGESTGASVGTADITIPYGKNKGKPLSDPTVAIDDLNYHLKNAQASLEDPDKKKWRKDNTRLVEGLKAEIDRRTKAAQEAETPTTSADKAPEARPEPADSGRASTPKAEESPSAPAPAASGTKSRGALIADVFRLLGEAVPNGKQNQAGQSKLLRRLCADLGVKETGAISELDDKTLAMIASIPLENLKTVANAIGA